MPLSHIVIEGDHLTKIARQYGFLSYETIWHDPANSGLRETRRSPNILFPGDELHVPEKRGKWENAAATCVHTFVVPTEKLKLRVSFLDFHKRPVPDLEVAVEVQGRTLVSLTDGEGMVEFAIQATAEIGLVRAGDLKLPIRIGHLNPLEKDPGWRQRLLNLGYLSSAASFEDGADLRSALEEFQCDHDLPLSGEPDPATLAALESVYGC